MTADETGMAEFHRVTGTLGLDTAKVIIKKDKGAFLSLSHTHTHTLGQRVKVTFLILCRFPVRKPGECTPGEPAAVPLESVSRKRRNVVLPVLAAEEQGSGDDTSFFRSTGEGPDKHSITLASYTQSESPSDSL